MKCFTIVSAATSIAVFTATAAAAQDAAPQSSQKTQQVDDSGGLGDIVVVATKKARAEQLQNVPLAITAFGQEQLKATFATDITDIGQLAPNVRLQTVGSIPGVANFTIRGMGVDSSIASDEPTVGEFVDGVYLGVNYGSVIPNFDLESIEVLRGPQGTLFGRNVTGGAVVIQTKRPTGKFSLDTDMIAGTAGRMEVGAAIEDRLTDTLSGRLSVGYRSLDGYFRNAAKNGQQIDFRSDVDVRPTLRWRPDGRTDITLIGQYSRYRDGGIPGRLLDTPGYGLFKSGYRPPADRFTLDQDSPGYSNTTIASATLEAKRDIGAGTLTSITGFRDVRSYTQVDPDASRVALFRNYAFIRQKQVSEELRYAGTTLNGALDYTVGLYGFWQDLRSQAQLYIISAPTRSLIADGRIKETSLAAFAQLEWRFAAGFSVLGGLRASYDHKGADIGTGLRSGTTGACDPAVLPAFQCVPTFSDGHNWTDLSPKIGLTYKADSNMLLFATFTRGFRSGGYNIRNYVIAASPGPYMPESVSAFEGGIKKDWLNHRVRTNVTAFYNRYSNLQRTVLSPNATSAILNAANARIWGAEFEASIAPFTGFRLDGSAGYTNASYARFNGLDLTGDGVPDPLLAKNLKLERAPKWTWSVSASYEVKTDRAGAFRVGATYSHTDSMPVDTANSFFLNAYNILDASLRWTTPDKTLSVSLYGKNLTNEYYAVTGFNVASVGHGIYLAPPRNYGVELRAHF